MPPDWLVYGMFVAGAWFLVLGTGLLMAMTIFGVGLMVHGLWRRK